MTIELTEPEMQTLLSLLDVAVRAQGLRAAETALLFVEKLRKAAEAEKE